LTLPPQLSRAEEKEAMARAEAVIHARKRSGEWSAGVKAHTEYQKRPLEWIVEKFGHLGFTRKDIILASQKELVFGDALIDDSDKNARLWKECHPFGRTLTIRYPHCDSDPYGWDFISLPYSEAEVAWQHIDDYIRKFNYNFVRR